MNITYVRKLHELVIHIEKAASPLKRIYAEGRWVSKLNEKQLISVCKECFSSPR